jgi:hypothetical protein
MFQLREFLGGHHAAKIEAELFGAGFHPDGIRPGAHVLILPYPRLSGERHNIWPREAK